MNTNRSVAIVATLLAISACSSREDGVNPKAGAKAGKPATQSAEVDAQVVKSPCEWLTTAEVSAAFGPLTGAAYRAGNAENFGTDENGEACAYPLSGDAHFVVQVDLTGAPSYAMADSMIGNVVAQEQPDLAGELSATPEKRTDGWDDATWSAGIRIYRLGHVAVLMNVTRGTADDALLDRLALQVRGKIADKPFVKAGHEESVAGDEPDPCQLITRAEAESVLGPLIVAPYRSVQSSVLAHRDGWSCTYYGPGHRALIVDPLWADGKDKFQNASMLGGLVRSKLGGADDGDLLDGPWEKATAGTSGEIIFLSGDTALEVTYLYSGTDIEGATKLAAIAMPRAIEIAAKR